MPDETFTFRPPAVRRGLQLALGIPLSLLILGITLVTLWLLWSPRVLRYAIDGASLTVSSGAPPLVRERSFPLDDIAGADIVELDDGKRVVGTAMPGYCAGWFRYDSLGKVWQATNCARTVVMLEVEGQRWPVLLSPPQPELFIAAISSGEPFEAEPVRIVGGSGFAVVKWTMLVLVPLCFLIPVLFVIAPRMLRYRVVAGAVEVSTLWTRRFPVTGCEARIHSPEVGLKLWGSAFPGYYTGLFRADGRRTKIYATSLKHGVLIEGEGLRLYLSPEDPEAFLNALRGYAAVS